MGRPGDESAGPDADRAGMVQFERFNQPGYAFSAVRGGVAGWLLRRVWVIPLLILLAMLLVNLSAYQVTPQRAAAVDIARARINGIAAMGRSQSGQYRLVHTGRERYALNCPQPGPATLNIDGTVHRCVAPAAYQTSLIFIDSYVYLAPIFLIFLAAAALYTLFIHQAPKAFYALARTKRLIPNEKPAGAARWLQPQGAGTYVDDFEKALQGRAGKIFALALQFMLVVLLILFAVGRSSLARLQSGFWPASLGEAFLIFIVPVLSGPVVALGIWVILVTGLYLAWLTPAFRLDLQPYHADGCGGLKPAGDVALLMALICIIPGALLGLWAFRGLLDRSIEAVSILVYFLMALLAVVALVAFFLPTVRIHRAMARQRAAFERDFQQQAAERLEALKTRLRRLVAVGQDQGEKARALKYRLELLEKLYPPGAAYRTWPFDYTALVTFAIGQALQYLPLLASWIQRTLNRLPLR